MAKRVSSGRCTPPVVTSARRQASRGFSGRTNGSIALDVEADEHDVPVLDDVVAALEAHPRLLAGLRPGAGGHDISPAPYLRRDETALHVGVDPARREPRRRALLDGPRPALLLVEGEERDELESAVRRPDELLEARGLYPEHLQVLPRLIIGQFCHLGLELRRDSH